MSNIKELELLEEFLSSEEMPKSAKKVHWAIERIKKLERDNESLIRLMNMTPQDLDKLNQWLSNDDLRAFKEKAQGYARKFVDKVESGKARSKETYADMKDLLNESN